MAARGRRQVLRHVLLRQLPPWRRDSRGSVLPLIALMFAVLLGAAALSVDYGFLFYAKRRTQAAADLAALAAATLPSDADRIARRSLADNKFAGSLVIEAGRYVPDGGLAPSARFQPGGVPANAARVTLGTSAQTVLAQALTGRSNVPVGASATAAKSDVAGFTLGTRAAGLQAGVANALLGAMLGTSVSLSVLDYNALVDAKVDAFRFLDALAVNLDLRAATYSQVVQSQASVGQMSAAFATAAQASGTGFTAVTALTQVSAGLVSATNRVPVASMVSLGDLGQGLVGSADPARPAPVGAMDFLAGLAELSNGSRQVQVDLGPSLPGIASTKMTIAIGERAQSGTSLGPPGLTVRTSQARLLLEAKIPAPLGLGQIDLPIYIDLAGATGTLTSITCPWSSPDQIAATVVVQPGLVDAAIASVPATSIRATGPAPALGTAATLVQLPLVTVTGRGRVTGASPNPKTLTFNRDDIETVRVRTATSTGLTGSVVSTLAANLVVNVDVAGLGIGLPASTLRPALLAAVAAAAPVLDTALDTTLRSLGLGLGQADVWINAVRCDRAVLVQ